MDKIQKNSQGLGPGKEHFIQYLCNTNHIIFIQEHWLHESNVHCFDNHIASIQSHVVSDKLVNGRPYGGTAILWRDNILLYMVSVLHDCKRLCSEALC